MVRKSSLRERIVSAIASVILCTFLASSMSLIGGDASNMSVRSAAPGSFYGEPRVASSLDTKWSAKVMSGGNKDGKGIASKSESVGEIGKMEGVPGGLLMNSIALFGMIVVTITFLGLVGSAVIPFQYSKQKKYSARICNRGPTHSSEPLIAQTQPRSASAGPSSLI